MQEGFSAAVSLLYPRLQLSPAISLPILELCSWPGTTSNHVAELSAIGATVTWFVSVRFCLISASSMQFLDSRQSELCVRRIVCCFFCCLSVLTVC